MPESGDSTDIADAAAVSAGWLNVDVVEDAGCWAALAPVERLVGAAALALAEHPRFAGHAPAEACVALSDDASVRRLNASYRAKDKPTNVLSFPAGRRHEQGRSRVLGDIVLACETLFREASEQRVEPAHHLQHLVVHGILHLLGYDHEADEEAEAMEALEVEILGRLGIASPYADEPLRSTLIES